MRHLVGTLALCVLAHLALGAHPAGASTTASSALYAAADTVPPQVRDPQGFRREIDRRYPAALREEGARGTAVFRVSVSPRGRATGVTLDRSSGHGALDEAAAAALRRARFLPARHRGEAVRGSLRMPITLRPPVEEVAGPREESDDERWRDYEELVRRHALATRAFERARDDYTGAVASLRRVGERWERRRAALAEAEQALGEAREAEASENRIRMLERVVERHRGALEPEEAQLLRWRARTQLLLEDVQERAATLQRLETELRGGGVGGPD